MSTLTDSIQPSYSTPLHSTSSTDSQRGRPRRHTITRPDSAMAFLSDMEEEVDGEADDVDVEQQQAFDRISSILSNLIQEANDAVQDIEEERVHLLSTTTSSSSHKQRNDCSNKNSTACRRRRKHQRVYPSFSNVTSNSSSSSTSSSSISLQRQKQQQQQQHQLANVPTNTEHIELDSNTSAQAAQVKKKKCSMLPRPMTTDTANPIAKWATNYDQNSGSVPSPPYSPVESKPPVIPATSASTSSIASNRTASSTLLTYPTKKRQLFRYTSQSRSAIQLMASSSSIRQSITVRTPKSNTIHSKKRMSPSVSIHGYLHCDNSSNNKNNKNKGNNNNNNNNNSSSRESAKALTDDMLEASFKRLDSSMALIDSLSKDLAGTQNTTDQNNSISTSISTSLFNAQNAPVFTIDATRLTVLLLVPLLHIPHSLITMMFDFCFYYNHSPTSSSSSPSQSVSSIRGHLHQQQQIASSSSTSSSLFSSSPFNFSSMILWACVFAVTNFMVDQVAVITPSAAAATAAAATTANKSTILSHVRRLSATLLPGTFKAEEAEEGGEQYGTATSVKCERIASSNGKRSLISAFQQPVLTKSAKGEHSDGLLPMRPRRNSI